VLCTVNADTTLGPDPYRYMLYRWGDPASIRPQWFALMRELGVPIDTTSPHPDVPDGFVPPYPEP
jgi:hypothetical protein